jgi:hypothetical protein
MTYFITEEQRRGSCFFEFQKGKPKRWGRNKFWKEDSLLLHMDIFDELNLHPIFLTVLPEFEYTGETLVTQDQYEILKKLGCVQGGETSKLFSELDVWASKCFQTENCFTILGI